MNYQKDYIPAPDGYEEFYKKKKSSRIYWTSPIDRIGEMCFSFDRKRIYNLFADFPHNLSKEEVAIFCEDEPYWADFFKDRLT